MSASTILEDISQALELWSQQLHNVETKIRRVADFQETLVADLRRKVDASIISEQDSIEFEYIADLWLNLYKSFICFSAGAAFADPPLFNNDEDFDEPDDLVPREGGEPEGLDDPAVPEPEIPPTHFE